MVDINLFEDDEEETGETPEKQPSTEDTSWDAFDSGDSDMQSSASEEESQDTDSLDDAFGFDDDFSDDVPLDDESILDESDAVPDFEDGEMTDDEDIYQFGEMKRKGMSKGLLVFLGIVLIGVVGYVAWMQGWLPTNLIKKQPSKTATKRTASVKPATTKPGQVKQKIVADSSVVAGRDSMKVPIGKSGSAPVNARVAATTNTIIAELNKTGKLGVLIIEKDRFRVEYISNKAGDANNAAERLKTLFNIDEVKQSPEEQISSNGSVAYSSVLSGTLPQPSKENPSGTPFVDNKAVQDAVANLASKSQLNTISFKMKSAQDRGQVNGAVFEGVYEGNQSQSLSMIKALSTIPSPLQVDKALVYPEQSKLVLNLWAAIQ